LYEGRTTTYPSRQASEGEDRPAFGSIMVAAWPRLYAYVWLLGGHHQDAEDVASETYERAYRAWIAGNGPQGDVMPWLLLIARRLLIDKRRRARLLTWLPLASISEPGREDPMLVELEASEWFSQLRHALPKRQHEALLLRYQFDLTDDAIGQLMGLSGAGVRTLVSRAIGSLRRHPEVLGL